MHTVDIKIFCTAQTRMNGAEVRRWLDHIGAKETPVPYVGNIDDKEVTDAGAVCGLCAKRCYMSFEPGLNPNVTKVRKVWHDYLANILKQGHGSVIEHASWTFAIEGVSRVFTGELNRHRAGVAISEGSMRYIRFDDIGFWMPISLKEGNMLLMPTRKCKDCYKGQIVANPDSVHQFPKDCGTCHGTGRLYDMDLEDFEGCKADTRDYFKKGFKEMEDNYKELCTIWDIENMKTFSVKKKLTSMFRRLIGMGVATGGTWTFNARALRHVIAMRTSPHAEEEIALAIGMVGKYIVESEPSLFGDFSIDADTGAWVPKNVKI